MKITENVCVISSCFHAPFHETVSTLGQYGINNIDLYCFEDEDAKDINKKGALEFTPYGFKIVDVDLLNDWISENLVVGSQRAGAEVALRAITSNFPQIAEPAGESRDCAVSCIRSLIQLAQLRGLHSIQLRAGRRIQTQVVDTNNAFKVYYDGDDAGFDRLIEGLSEVFNEDSVGSSVGVALEIEPGLPYIVRGVSEHLTRLAEKVLFAEHAGKLPPGRVGLNLDIGHIFLLRDTAQNETLLTPETLLSSGTLPLPIFSAHISDHSRHHFADLPPGSFHRIEEFEEWLEFYFKTVPEVLSSQSRKFYTNTVSVELEAHEYMQRVARSYRTVHHIVTKPRRDPQGHKYTLDSSLLPASRPSTIVIADLRHSTDITCLLEDKGDVKAVGDFTQTLFDIFAKELPDGTWLDKFIGDAVMIVCDGPPEVSAEVAIQAALRIQANLVVNAPEFVRFRSLIGDFKIGVGFGVASGEVVKGWFGPSPYEERTALGSPVILASRLSSEAKTGEILISHDVVKAQQNILDSVVKADKDYHLTPHRDPIPCYRYIQQAT